MSLWADIDTYLETEVIAEMGRGGEYTTLLLQESRIDDYWQLDKIDKENKFPFAFFRGYEMTQTPDGFGDGELHTSNTYPYVWVCAIKATSKRQAKVQAQEMLSRMRKFMRKRPTFRGLITTDTERISVVPIGKATVEIIGRLDQTSGTFYGMAILFFAIETNI